MTSAKFTNQALSQVNNDSEPSEVVNYQLFTSLYSSSVNAERPIDHWAQLWNADNRPHASFIHLCFLFLCWTNVFVEALVQ